jgi:hypothetical protein
MFNLEDSLLKALVLDKHLIKFLLNIPLKIIELLIHTFQLL